MAHSKERGIFARAMDSIIEARSRQAARFANGALLMLERQRRKGVVPRTLGGDAGYDVHRFIEAVRYRGITPHIASTRNVRRRSWIDGRTKRHAGYALSQRIRKRVEETFGWAKAVGNFRKTRYRGLIPLSV